MLFASDVLMLKEDVNTVNTSSFTYFIQDKNAEMNASDILHSSRLKRSTKDGNQGNTQGPFWSKLRLQNDSNKSRTLILHNPLAGMNYIDVYLYQKSILKKKILLGDMRKQENRMFLNRYSAFELLLAPHEEITIISKLDNFTVIYIGWILQESRVFIEEESKFLTIFSLVAGSFIFLFLLHHLYLHNNLIFISIFSTRYAL